MIDRKRSVIDFRSNKYDMERFQRRILVRHIVSPSGRRLVFLSKLQLRNVIGCTDRQRHSSQCRIGRSNTRKHTIVGNE